MSTTSLFAFGPLARLAKEKEVTAWKETLSADELSSMMTLPPLLSPSPSTILLSSLKRRKGTLSLLAEYKRNLSLDSSSGGAGFVTEMPPPNLMSPVFRDFGASAVSVMADSRIGGCDYGDLAAVAEEQENARGNIPGPLPLVCGDMIVDEVQVARAKSVGCSGAVVDFELLGSERSSAMCSFAAKLGIESVLFLPCLPSEVSSALATVTSSEILVVRGVKGGKEEIDWEALEIIREIVPKEKCLVCEVKGNDEKDLAEVEYAWRLRDLGYNAVWVSDCLFKGGQDETEHAGAVIKAMIAKTSLKFGNVKSRSGRGEGAREYLGDIMM